MRAATIYVFVALSFGIGAATSHLSPSGPTTNEPSAAHNRRLLQEPPSPAEAEPTLAEVYFNQNGTTLDEAHVWFEEADASGNGLVSYKELEAWMSTQGFTLYSEFHIIFDSYDQDSDAHLNVIEFGQLMDSLTEPLPPPSKLEKVFAIVGATSTGIMILLACWAKCCGGCDCDLPSFSSSSSRAPVHLPAPHGTTAALPVHTATVCLPGSGSSDLEKGSS